MHSCMHKSALPGELHAGCILAPTCLLIWALLWMAHTTQLPTETLPHHTHPALPSAAARPCSGLLAPGHRHPFYRKHLFHVLSREESCERKGWASHSVSVPLVRFNTCYLYVLRNTSRETPRTGKAIVDSLLKRWESRPDLDHRSFPFIPQECALLDSCLVIMDPGNRTPVQS